MAIEFDGTRVEVSRFLETTYRNHIMANILAAREFLGEDEVFQGKVKQSWVGQSNSFVVDFQVPNNLRPSMVRRSLRLRLQDLELQESDKAEVGFICFLMGAHWLQELTKMTAFVHWLEEKGATYSWSKLDSGTILINDTSMVRRVRLTLLDR